LAIANIYSNYFKNILNGDANVGNLKCALLDVNGTFDNLNEDWVDISANEIADADYAQQVLTGVVVSVSGNTVNLTADNITFGNPVNITANNAVIYDSLNNKLMFHVDFETVQESINSEFTLNVNASGLFDVTT